MQMLYSNHDLQLIFSGQNIIFKQSTFDILNVSIDSRTIKNNGLFIAIKGEKMDGHDFIEQAIQNGAICVIISRITDKIQKIIDNQNINFIIVKDTLQALEDIATFQRNRLKSKVVCI